MHKYSERGKTFLGVKLYGRLLRASEDQVFLKIDFFGFHFKKNAHLECFILNVPMTDLHMIVVSYKLYKVFLME